MTLLRKFITVIVVSAVYVEGSSQEDHVLPVMVFDEGDTALIPCIKEANENDFFWSKGKWFDNGTNIAYIARGIPSKSDKYDVYIDGTLVIQRISLADEGNYFCRILSDSTESYVGVRILIKVNPEAIDIAIEECTPSSSCVKVLEPSLEFQLTCTANTVAGSMTLKWYNGSKEIIGNVYVSDTSGNKVKMTNVVKVMFEEESYLTCEAEGVNVAKSMAVIQLRKEEVEKEATITLLVPTIVLFIICLILIGILIYLTVRHRRLHKGQGKAICIEMNLKGAKPGNDKTEDQTEEEKHLVDKSDTDLATKEGELQKQREEIKAKNVKIMEKEEVVEKLQAELKETKKALEENKGELAKATMVLQKKEKEAKNLHKDLREANAKLLAFEVKAENLQKDLREANTKLLAFEDEGKVTAIESLF